MKQHARDSRPIVRMFDASFAYGSSDENGGPEADGACGSSEDKSIGARGITLCVEAGECLVLCGSSGSGKSTVLRMIDGLAGTFFPGVLAGRIEVCGCDVRDWSARSRAASLGVVMQDPRSQFFMDTVFDEIAFASENLGIAPDETIARVKHAARLTGVTDLLEENLTRLSSGQKQRVALAAAIAGKPSLLLLDEPTSNLDDEGARILVDIIANLKRQGIALVISEHRLHRFAPVADAYLCLSDGCIAKRWSAEEFMGLSADEVAVYGLRHPDAEREGTHPACILAKQKPPILHAAKPSDPFVLHAGGHSAHMRLRPAGASGRSNASSLWNATLTKGSDWSVRDLIYEYPLTKRGVRGVSARFASGAVTVVSGANGVGKTTLARVLCGALREQGGRVLRGDESISRSDRRRSSYFVMQDADYQLYAGSVSDEVVLGRRMDEAVKNRAWTALDAFGLRDLADRHPLSLSGGQKQRVTLAAAYCSDADLVVLDEPTSGLDGRGAKQISDWCRTLAEFGKTIVIITHDQLLVNLAADAVIELERT